MSEVYRPARLQQPLIGGRKARSEPLTAPIYRPFTATRAEAESPAPTRRETWKLALYAGAIVLASALSEPLWLGLGLAVVLTLARGDAAGLLRRALFATLLFSGVVSAAYVAQVLWLGGALPWGWLLSVNLRVLLMTSMTFLCIARINLFAALAFSRRLSFMLALAVGQASGLRRTLADFRLALRARGMRRGALRDRYRATAHAVVWLLDRALANAHESAQAMQARGMFR